MAVITKQELQCTGKWWTWINYEGLNTFIIETNTQISEAEAVAMNTKYLDDHLYDNIPQVRVDIYDNREILRNAIVFIRIENPSLAQWNTYLASLSWDNALMVRWFLAILALRLSERYEISLSSFTETEVLNRLKTFIINAPVRRLEKILFGM